MKKVCLLLIGFGFLSVNAQSILHNSPHPDKELPISEEKLKVNNLIKNPGAEDVDVNGYIIDKRAVKYYHPGSLDNISLEKARKINFIYLKSFEILMLEKLKDECLMYMRETFDTGSLNHLRKWDEPVLTDVKWKDCEISISLMSWNHIHQLFSAK